MTSIHALVVVLTCTSAGLLVGWLVGDLASTVVVRREILAEASGFSQGIRDLFDSRFSETGFFRHYWSGLTGDWRDAYDPVVRLLCPSTFGGE